MKSYIEYLEGGNNIQYLLRWLSWHPKDENGNPKEEIPNNISAGYVPGLIWYLLNKNKLNEKTSTQTSKNTSSSNSKHGSKYVVNIPAGVTDTVVTFPRGRVSVSNNFELVS